METISGKTVQEVLLWASSFLQEHSHYTKEEASQLVKRLLCHYLKMNYTQWILSLGQTCKIDTERFLNDLKQLSQHYPIQYLIGEEEFYGYNFYCTPDTLIPRPETEELVDFALKLLKEYSNPQVLEIGVGTGCIICSLAMEVSEGNFLATDVSNPALSIAQKNIDRHGLDKIRLLNSDVFSNIPKEKRYDIIVSNPPYIGRDELSAMDISVIKYEPKEALFAQDDGYAIYQTLAKQIDDYLKPDGQALFEMGYRQGRRLKTLFEYYLPKRKVEIIKDLSGNDRILYISKELQESGE